MKLIPILFNTEMVRAIKSGAKKQTRRIKGEMLKRINDNLQYPWKVTEHASRWSRTDAFGVTTSGRIQSYTFQCAGINTITLTCPYGQVGDVLWVRETYMKYHPVDPDGYTNFDETVYAYAADSPERIHMVDGDGFQMFNKNGSEKLIPFRPSIHMPYEACRIWLRIVSTRIERLQEITEADAIAEGVYCYKLDDPDQEDYRNYLHKGDDDWGMPTAIGSYQTLWQSINGPESWDANPFVWVVEFELTEKPV